MSLVKDIKVGDHIYHYGTYRPVVAKTGNGTGSFILTVKELYGFLAERVERETTNIPTTDNGATA